MRYSAVLSRNPALSGVPLVGIIKEVAEDDVKLGVEEFQTDYFGGRALYLDESKSFYEFLGNRKLISLSTFFSWKLLKPWEIYSDFKAMGKRLEAKKIEGNMAGEGLIQGGLLVMAPGEGEKVLFLYEEETGSEIPLDEFEQGLLKLLTCKAK